MGGIEAALAEHAFEHLFIECLGWDRVRTTITFDIPDGHVEAASIAQKRGFTVFLASTHRTVLANRSLLRKIQRRLRKSYHEHILIHCCETPRKQVWQWATTIGDGTRILHREHPFFSIDPPPRLLERIRGLAVSVEDEERTMLPDVLDLVRTALMPDNELNLFAKRPWYAAESDRLAMAIKRGDPGAFGRFIEFHMPLAQHWSRRMRHWFAIDPEDAEQTAMIGLIEAARRFDPERGFQFSTYAGFWIRQCCQRYGLEWGMAMRVPTHLFWPCYRLIFIQARLIATHGEREAERRFDDELAAAGISRTQWMTFCAARHTDVVSSLDRQDRLKFDVADESQVIDEASACELRDAIRRSLRFLVPRHAQILRLRYGIDEQEHTLREAAEKLGVTRERVRQLQVRAEEKLHRILGDRALLDDANDDEASEDEHITASPLIRPPCERRSKWQTDCSLKATSLRTASET